MIRIEWIYQINRTAKVMDNSVKEELKCLTLYQDVRGENIMEAINVSTDNTVVRFTLL